MKLEILDGPAGSGKTGRMLASVRQRTFADVSVSHPQWARRVSTWLIVPDQASFVMEKRVLDTLGDAGGAVVRVFSLNRLARHILSETGGNARPFLDAAGKGVLVYRVVRALADRLPLFSDAIRKGGFAQVAGDLLTECRRYGISPEELRSAADRAGEVRLAVKLRELAEVGEAVRATMEAGGYLDGEDMLMMAAERLHQVPDVDGIHLCIDQFQRLSPVQLRLLFSCIRHMASVTVSLRLKEEEPEFSMSTENLPGRSTRQVKEALLQFARDNGIPVVQTCITGRNLGGFFPGAPYPGPLDASHFEDKRHLPGSGLAFLSRHLSSPGFAAYASPPEDLRMAVFANPEEEIHACATQLVRLCREEGCRYRELAVLVPDVSEYASGVRRIFRLHEIPFFMDRKESLAGHPVSVALLTPFDVLRGGWRHDDVFRLLKTGLLPVSEEMVDRLENHALAVGLRGQRLWCTIPLAEETMEAARQNLVTPLIALRRVLRGQVPVREALDAYLDMLLSWRIPQTIASQARRLTAQGQLAAAGHMRQIWKSCCNLLDQILELGGTGTLSLIELHGMLQSGLEGGTTVIIPPSLDEVFVGTPSRSQVAEVRHLFVLGAVEGWLPSAPGGQGVLTDADRRRLRDCGLQLAPDTREAGRERRDELDAVLVMSTEGLWLSRPVSDQEGKALHPSSLIEEVRRMFPGLREGWLPSPSSEWEPEVDLATTPQAMLDRLAPLLQEKQTQTETEGFHDSLLHLLGAYPTLERSLRSFHQGREWRNQAALHPDWMRARYGTQMHSSISALEMYRRCPFSWFARHAAQLREREEIGLRDIGFGLLMHDVMDALVAEVEACGGWDAVEEYDVERIIERAVQVATLRGTGISPLHPGLSDWFVSRMTKAARVAASRVFHQIRGGAFRPMGHEVGFGTEGPFPPFCVPLPDGGQMRLAGRLDRLDVHEAPEGRYVRVVDYKSGDRSLSLADIANGLSLQLPAYLTVALASLREEYGKGLPVHPAGIFHMRLEPPDIRLKDGSGEGAEAERGKRMRLSGYVLDDPAIVEAMDAQMSRGGASSLVKVSMNRNGTIAARTKTLSETGFEHLGDMLREQLARMGTEMLEGKIPVHPVRLRDMKACTQCPYIRVCRFEPGVGGAGWDRPPATEEGRIRERLEQEEQDEMDD